MVAKYLKSFCFCALLAGAGLSFAQEAERNEDLQLEESSFDFFQWQTSGTGTLGLQGTIEIPEGYRFLNGIDATKLMNAIETSPSKYEGMIAPHDYRWLAVFQFTSEGYVNDSEKNDLDPHELLAALQDSKKFAQKLTFKHIGSEIVSDWISKPVYRSNSNNLEWSLKLINSKLGQETVATFIQILGRHGYMNVSLGYKVEQHEEILPEFKKMLTGFKYNRGYSYAEFQEGDKRAKYGLKGVVAGEAFHYDEQPKYLTFLKENVAYIIAGIIVIIAAVAAGLFIIRQTSNT